MTNPPKMSDVPMHPQPPSNEDGFFGRPEPDFDAQSLEGGTEAEANSWLLDKEGEEETTMYPSAEGEPAHEEVHALPGEFAEREGPVDGWLDGEGDGEAEASGESALEGFVEGLATTDPSLGASFVEPEATSQAFSRALVPAGVALLVSFGGIAVWAFVKKPATSTNPVDIELATPDPVDNLEGRSDEEVLPLGAQGDESSGRVSFQRDGSTKNIGGNSGAKAPAPTVTSPREPGELPPGALPTGTSQKSKGQKSAAQNGGHDRPSFSNFGGLSAAVNPKDTLEVESTDEDFETVAMNAAKEFDAALDPDVTDEVLDAFGSLEDDLFLPQSFMDSFVLSLDPIDDVASIYGDIDTHQEVDSFEELGFMAHAPFDEEGFGSFRVAQWEGLGSVAQAEEPEFEVFLPFGMFEDETVASVEVGPEESVDVEVAMEGVEPEAQDVVVEESSPMETPEAESTPTESEVMAADLLELAALFESVEEQPVEVAVDPTIEQVDAPSEELVAELPAVEPAVEPAGETLEEVALVETEETPSEIDAPEMIEAEFEGEVAIVAEPEPEPEPEPESESEVLPDTELDLEAAHARLDAMFGPVQPPQETLVAEEVPEMSEVFPAPVEVEVSEPEPSTEIALEELIEETPGETVADADEARVEEEVAVEAPIEEPTVVAMEEPVDAPADVSVEVPAEVAVETEVISQPEPEVAMAEPEAIEVLENIADEVPTGRRSALKRFDGGNVWKNRTVPKSKLRGDKFVLTPNVGNVRVIFDGGESVDGRLHGLGDQKIVLDTKLGRMTLDSRRAERIDRLGGGRRAELRSPSDSQNSTKGLERVKVRAAGGVFYGHLVAQTDEKVTLLLDGGVRVTIDSTDVEVATARRATSRMRRPK